MKYWISFLLVCGEAFGLSISPQDAEKIGERIWRNECKGTREGLTSWNKGENFASMGIGHFIWYTADCKEQFQETFPTLLAFLQKEGAALPDWLKVGSACPWNSREEFQKEIQSAKMESLRQFLYATRSLQAVFIANRLEAIFPQLLESCPQRDREKITTLFHRLSQDADGLYALIDYLNFKGSGTSAKEMYRDQGWGLLQVLQRISPDSKQPLVDFVEAAKATLKKRVENSPPERNEEKWLKGWFNRLDTYLKK